MLTELENESLKLDNQLCFPLYATARRITGLYTPYLKELGITYTQYIVFLVLWENDNLTVGEIGKRLFLDNGTLTPLLKKMQTEGFITRTRSSSDERVVTISLTEQGKQLKEKAKTIPQVIGSCIPLEPEEIATLYSLLHKTLNQIDGDHHE